MTKHGCESYRKATTFHHLERKKERRVQHKGQMANLLVKLPQQHLLSPHQVRRSHNVASFAALRSGVGFPSTLPPDVWGGGVSHRCAGHK